MEPDLDELTRKDIDDECAYTPEDLMNGEIVIRNENHGYWNSTSKDTYANPFFVKLCRALWAMNPQFMVIGECWGGMGFENRQIIMTRSGIIPRLYNLPQTIASLFGKKLYKDGRVQSQEVKSVTALKEWYVNTRRFLPPGSILLQSSSAHCWPYPAFLYGKGSWAAVDILYFMPDIPFTFMGEVDGEVYRLEIQSVF
jgi:starch synthase